MAESPIRWNNVAAPRQDTTSILEAGKLFGQATSGLSDIFEKQATQNVNEAEDSFNAMLSDAKSPEQIEAVRQAYESRNAENSPYKSFNLISPDMVMNGINKRGIALDEENLARLNMANETSAAKHTGEIQGTEQDIAKNRIIAEAENQPAVLKQEKSKIVLEGEQQKAQIQKTRQDAFDKQYIETNGKYLDTSNTDEWVATAELEGVSHLAIKNQLKEFGETDEILDKYEFDKFSANINEYIDPETKSLNVKKLEGEGVSSSNILKLQESQLRQMAYQTAVDMEHRSERIDAAINNSKNSDGVIDSTLLRDNLNKIPGINKLEANKLYSEIYESNHTAESLQTTIYNAGVDTQFADIEEVIKTSFDDNPDKGKEAKLQLIKIKDSIKQTKDPALQKVLQSSGGTFFLKQAMLGALENEKDWYFFDSKESKELKTILSNIGEYNEKYLKTFTDLTKKDNDLTKSGDPTLVEAGTEAVTTNLEIGKKALQSTVQGATITLGYRLLKETKDELLAELKLGAKKKISYEDFFNALGQKLRAINFEGQSNIKQ